MPGFDALEQDVIQPGLCTHCGTCAGLSGGTLAMVETPNGPLPQPVREGGELPDFVVMACPGKRIDYPGLHAYVFGRHPENWLAGCYEQAYIGYSAVPEVRRRGASGGVITQTLIYLLDNGLIDGAVVIRMGSPSPWQAEPIIARTRDEILACSQSVYAPIPVNVILSQIEAFNGRLAYVGLPDQVASLRQLQRMGHKGALKIAYVLGPYVGTNMYFESVMSYLRSNGVRSRDEIAELRYREGEWPGNLYVRTHSGKELRAKKFYYNYLIPFYITRSTLYAIDFTNELTDISVGDAWSPRFEAQGQGFSVVLARTEKGRQVLEAAQQAGLLHLEHVGIDEALSMHGHMLDFKKRGAFIRLEWRRKRGLPVPEYGLRPVFIPHSRVWVERVIALIFAVCSSRVARRVVEWIPIGIIGPVFDLMRRTWKRVSKPVKREGLHTLQFEIIPEDK